MGTDLEQNDSMVITVEIANFVVKKLHVPQSEIRPHHEQLVGFSSEQVDTRGYVNLLTTFGDAPPTPRRRERTTSRQMSNYTLICSSGRVQAPFHLKTAVVHVNLIGY
ncbi:hypothetical protein CR513_48455, partial [Mucuna pruriens]